MNPAHKNIVEVLAAGGTLWKPYSRGRGCAKDYYLCPVTGGFRWVRRATVVAMVDAGLLVYVERYTDLCTDTSLVLA